MDETGRRFLANVPGAELAPGDVVARVVWRHLTEGHKVLLDARRKPGTRFAQRFPAIAAACHLAGYDPARQLIPIRPAAHYHMGGIAVDAAGRSSVPGLWACGEARLFPALADRMDSASHRRLSIAVIPETWRRRHLDARVH